MLVDPTGWQSWWDALPRDDATTKFAGMQGFVLSTAQTGELGWSRSQTRTHVRRDRWLSPAHGVVAPFAIDADEPDRFVLARRRHALRAAAGALVRPDHIVVARSAAVLHGLPTCRVPSRAELQAPWRDGLGDQHFGHAYSARLTAASVEAWHGVPVTCVERTLVDLARHDRFDAIMAGDSALRHGLVDPGELDLDIAAARGWPGVVGARDVLALLDGRAESPLESAVRLALHDDGFPPPDLQVWIGEDRVDLYWREQRLVLEADGRLKYVRASEGEQRDALWREKQREGRLRGHDCTVERVIWSDVFGGWRDTSRRLWRFF